MTSLHCRLISNPQLRLLAHTLLVLVVLVVSLPFTSGFVLPEVQIPTTAHLARSLATTRSPFTASPITTDIFRHPRRQRHSPYYALFNLGGNELSQLVYDSTSTAFDAWEWTANIGAPAALVAGAVLVTLSETREDTAPRRSDNKNTRFLKLAMRFLLLTSFALETISIFVSTVTGSVLLGHGEQTVASKMVGYMSPLQLMHHHHEFAYLTTQICFLQGLFHWLASVAMELLLPREKETTSAKFMNRCLTSWLVSLCLWMLAFYNHHLSFYSDYFAMLRRFFVLFVQKYVLERPIRPLSLLYIPSFLYSVYSTVRAFRSPPELDDD